MKKIIFVSSLVIFNVSLAFAEDSKNLGQAMNYESKEDLTSYAKQQVDSYRVNPFPNAPLATSGGNEASRYRTDQGWSRGSFRSGWGYWGGYGYGRGSDLPSSGYTEPSASR